MPKPPAPDRPPTTSLPTQLGDLSPLLPDWARHLRATNRAPSTIDSHLPCRRDLPRPTSASSGMPTSASAITREHLERFLADMSDRLVGRDRRQALPVHAATPRDGWRRTARSPRSPMARMRPPTVPEQPVAVLSEDDLGRLLARVQRQHVRDPSRHRAYCASCSTPGSRSARSSGSPWTTVDFELTWRR